MNIILMEINKEGLALYNLVLFPHKFFI